MLTDDPDGEPIVEVGNLDTPSATLILSRPVRPFDDEPVLDFLITARGEWGRVETPVRVWIGDGPGEFLFSLAEDFRGWKGTRTWEALDHSLSVSAEHRSLGRVHLTWTLSGTDIECPWDFSCTTVHAAGEDMRHLAADIREFLRVTAE
ncbi:DUF6228 family protein [Streptomyces sp. ST2-7A]|uniref:DUF6228 family protein n=1 Tax=Streptomyces sp. ST2-7A TaxID=2907214 RepID=UPI001F33FE9E|nr:DUF6228 family protein [Streptomyces sp. ST2-7A]MCE7080653.1 DUF6228 family protein [Streptomyces sp. ST2-7A]